MPRLNPMLKALDDKIAELHAEKANLHAQIVTLEATRRELEGLVRRRRAKNRTNNTPVEAATATPA